MQRQEKALENKDNQIRKLQRDLKTTQDKYDKICTENRELNAIFNKQRRDMERQRAREQTLKDAREKARVEEEERQAVRERCEKRRRENIQLEQFLEKYK